ncbi:UNVERIFIED_CONTAM: hypothetical protein Sradi_0660000 [Sesamum radiatum]|uniref:PB1-like domain-containing protein n=1 Tax=Sesamum radiatum TaxID=300843 RepID=A0AAW2VNK7_SESRA
MIIGDCSQFFGTEETLKKVPTVGPHNKMVVDDYADFYVWVGGVIEWTPTVRYVGGSKVWIPNVDRERIYYGDLLDMYVKAGGKGLNIVIYYCLPGQTMDNGIRMLNGDDGIRELLREYKGLSVIPIYFEEKQGPLLVIDTQGNILPIEDPTPSLPFHEDFEPCNYLNDPPNLNNDVVSEHPNTEIPPFNSPPNTEIPSSNSPLPNTEIPPVDEGMQGSEPSDGEGNDSESSSSDSSTSQCPSWLLEDLEGPFDDDIFEARPSDHTRKLFITMRDFVRAQKRKKKRQNNREGRMREI